MCVKPLCIANRSPSSIATISAQPMLRPSVFQPGVSFHESHSLSRTIPTPHEDDASTQNSMGEVSGGFVIAEPQNLEESWVRHHAISVMTLGFGALRTKEEDKKLNDAAKREIDGRCERPSGNAREQWTRVPRMDSTSFLMNFLVNGPRLKFCQVSRFFGLWNLDRFGR